MVNNREEKNCTSEKKIRNTDNIDFSVEFNKNGESFQNIMEKILINKLANITNN